MLRITRGFLKMHADVWLSHFRLLIASCGVQGQSCRTEDDLLALGCQLSCTGRGTTTVGAFSSLPGNALTLAMLPALLTKRRAFAGLCSVSH